MKCTIYTLIPDFKTGTNILYKFYTKISNYGRLSGTQDKFKDDLIVKISLTPHMIIM